MKPSIKKFLAACTIPGVLALGACKDQHPTAMSTPPSVASTPPSASAEPAQTRTYSTDVVYEVDTVRDPEDFRTSPTSYAFRAGTTTCWVDTTTMNPQCALKGEAGAPSRVALNNGAWTPVNEGPGAPAVPANATQLGHGEILAMEQFAAHHGNDGTLRISFPRQSEVPPLLIRGGKIVGE